MSGYLEIKLKLRAADFELPNKIIAEQALAKRIIPSSRRDGIMEMVCYDTSEGKLRHTGITYYVTRENNKYLATVKSTVAKRSGLYNSRVWNISVEGPEPNLIPFHSMEIGTRLKLFLEEDHNLVELFVMRLKCQSVVIDLPVGLLVELVSYRGEISIGEKSVEVAEIELEIKEGRVEDLLKFGAELVELYSLLPETTDLFDRGLELAGFNPRKEEEKWKKKLKKDREKEKGKKSKLKQGDTFNLQVFLPELLLKKIHGILEAQQAFLSNPEVPERLEYLGNKWRRLTSLVEFCRPLFSEANYNEIKKSLDDFTREFSIRQRTEALWKSWTDLVVAEIITLPQESLYQDVLASEKQVQEERSLPLLCTQVPLIMLKLWALTLEIGQPANQETEEIREMLPVDNASISAMTELTLAAYSQERIRNWLQEMLEAGKELDFYDRDKVEYLLCCVRVINDTFKQFDFVPEKFKQLSLVLIELREDLKELLESEGTIEVIKTISSRRSKRLLSYENGVLTGWVAHCIPVFRHKVQKSWSNFYVVATRILQKK